MGDLPMVAHNKFLASISVKQKMFALPLSDELSLVIVHEKVGENPSSLLKCPHILQLCKNSLLHKNWLNTNIEMFLLLQM